MKCRQYETGKAAESLHGNNFLSHLAVPLRMKSTDITLMHEWEPNWELKWQNGDKKSCYVSFGTTRLTAHQNLMSEKFVEKKEKYLEKTFAQTWLRGFFTSADVCKLYGLCFGSEFLPWHILSRSHVLKAIKTWWFIFYRLHETSKYEVNWHVRN